MKKQILIIPRTTFMASLAAGLAAVGLLLCGQAAQAQVINFDAPGGLFYANYSGQGALSDPGHNFWNAINTESPPSTTTGVLASDGVTASPITLTISYDGGYFNDAQGANGTPAGLFAPYLDTQGLTSAYTNTLNNVPAGAYNLYLYGNAGTSQIKDSDRGTIFTVSSDVTAASSLSTSNLPADYDTFVPAVNYVEFTPLVVGSGGYINIGWTANPTVKTTNGTYTGSNTYGVFNGLQLAPIPATAPVVSSDTAPAGTTTAYIYPGFPYTTSSFTAVFTGAIPITNQWLVSSNGGGFTAIPGQTTTTLTVTNSLLTSNEYKLFARNSMGSNNSTPAILLVTPSPLLQTNGDIIAELRSADLMTGGVETTWTNRSVSVNSVGNFMNSSNGSLLVSNAAAGANLPLWNGISVNALFVNNSASNALFSALQTPAEINGDNPVTMEAWVYCNAIVAQQNQLSYGLYGGTNAPEEEREFGYGTTGYAAFTSSYGLNGSSGSDTGWATAPTIGWHYLAATYDGTNLALYQDGVTNGAKIVTNALNTIQTFLEVGQGDGNTTDTGGSSPFHGYIASARVMSGVLTAGQISNNFLAGLPAEVPGTAMSLSAPTIQQEPTPASSNAYVGQTVSFTASFNGTAPITNQWQFSSGGIIYSNIAGANGTTLTLNHIQLTNAGSYILTASNAAGPGSPSNPATLTVAIPPAPGFSLSGGTLTLTFPAGGTLLEAPSPKGPWTPVATTSPFPVTLSSAKALFFTVNYGL